MEEIKAWKTSDGKIFNDKTAANLYEAKRVEADRLSELLLPDKYDTCDFANGSGYLQLSEDLINEFDRDFMKAINLYHREWKFEKYIPTEVIGRYLCDSQSPFDRPNRIRSRVDSKFRLWGQEYFVAHPSEAKQDRLN